MNQEPDIRKESERCGKGGSQTIKKGKGAHEPGVTGTLQGSERKLSVRDILDETLSCYDTTRARAKTEDVSSDGSNIQTGIVSVSLK